MLKSFVNRHAMFLLYAAFSIPFLIVATSLVMAFPRSAMAQGYESLLGKTLVEVQENGSCALEWRDSGEKAKGNTLWLCPSYPGPLEFDRTPALIMVKAGKIIGAGGILTQVSEEDLIMGFLKTKNRMNMCKECTQLSMAIGLEDVIFECNANHVMLDIVRDSDTPHVRLIFFQDFKKNMMGNSKKKLDFSDFL